MRASLKLSFDFPVPRSISAIRRMPCTFYEHLTHTRSYIYVFHVDVDYMIVKRPSDRQYTNAQVLHDTDVDLVS